MRIGTIFLLDTFCLVKINIFQTPHPKFVCRLSVRICSLNPKLREPPDGVIMMSSCLLFCQTNSSRIIQHLIQPWGVNWFVFTGYLQSSFLAVVACISAARKGGLNWSWHPVGQPATSPPIRWPSGRQWCGGRHDVRWWWWDSIWKLQRSET